MAFFDEHVFTWLRAQVCYAVVTLPCGSRMTRAYPSIAAMMRD